MRSLLPYANRKNLRQHVFVTPWSPSACHSEVAHGVRFAREVPRWLGRILLSMDTDNLINREAIAHREINVPYISCVRWSRDWTSIPPWKTATQPRRHLISFTGSTRGQPRNIALRKLLVKACNAAPRATCKAL